MNKQKIATAIRKKMAQNKHIQSDVADITGVDQTQISRVLKGDFVHITEKVRCLCDYANIDPQQFVDPTKSKLLMDALKKSWDGSRPKERALAKIIENLGAL